ncbi:cAMP-binding domain of CRP or a regulatory subunit of cAMP-dependent protein kinases [Collimonas sp. OK242]|uniref:Crp/Fnr family transcriptional regulator n=1 Tax=Collimonas sp. OK242 TaxID=1798195 RepID=UPI000896FEF5|nr:Crp/Fnr family transcriptional regulator [Collimonas sp. OK242]SDX10001.1 cAMP-binding domain of CRP or a regulatory subunit of cAMP-dependent protein kinases [Collimonas sp. OK242]
MGTVENHLIELLPRKERVRLLAVSELIELEQGEILCEPGKPIRHVYFPIDASISLMALIDGSLGVEVGMVGREGMLGGQMALGVAMAPVHAVVQSPGTVRRISVGAFRSELGCSTALQRGMHNYLYVRMAQMATSAACLRFHLIGPRLARWLLMSQDRAHSDHFRITHEFLATMLGVRREGITAAASALQRDGLIEYRRGNIKVLDRSGLEAAACACYEVERKAYAALL